jgi:hypothetical protein
MKIAVIVFASAAALLMLFQLTCGLWIRSKGADEAGKRFHTKLGISGILTGMVSSVLAIILAAG